MFSKQLGRINNSLYDADKHSPAGNLWIVLLVEAIVRALIFIGLCILKAGQLDASLVPDLDDVK